MTNSRKSLDLPLLFMAVVPQMYILTILFHNSLVENSGYIRIFLRPCCIPLGKRLNDCALIESDGRIISWYVCHLMPTIHYRCEQSTPMASQLYEIALSEVKVSPNHSMKCKKSVLFVTELWCKVNIFKENFVLYKSATIPLPSKYV